MNATSAPPTQDSKTNQWLEQLDPKLSELATIMAIPTGTSSAGFPYLERRAWERFRDRIPHILEHGHKTLALAAEIVALGTEAEVGKELSENLARALRVIRQVVFTSAVTAPPDLWLLRHVLSNFAELGLLTRLAAGDAIYPHACVVDGAKLDGNELEIDMHFLLARGIVEQYDNSFRAAGHPRIAEILKQTKPIADELPSSMARVWSDAFLNPTVSVDVLAKLSLARRSLAEVSTSEGVHNHWVPSLRDIEVGFHLVPLVLGLRAANLNTSLPESFTLEELPFANPMVRSTAVAILGAAGWIESVDSEGFRLTKVGQRGLARGAGPFGIIETYHTYMANGVRLLKGASHDERDIWVQRSENVGASQDANRKTFKLANDALDRFADDTGFSFSVFIEHAIGRGEATRQRYERTNDPELKFVGADLEDAAIDAAIAEQSAGHLPEGMLFVRNADIGKPDVLLDAMAKANLSSHGAVMLVGNGFHEVRGQTDEQMTEVFRGYHDAGVILVFTEENALSVDDLRATAFNTYHAGFKYVHEKSGQALRPAHPRMRPRLGATLRAPWSACAERAGYIRLPEYCTKTRTIYPYTPPDGHNPSISESHFVVPRSIAEELKLV